jgi:HTH-type transcriptional regulator / antitoxin HipB
VASRRPGEIARSQIRNDPDRFHRRFEIDRFHRYFDPDRFHSVGDMVVRSIRDIAAALRGRRQDLGLTQADLALRAGVSRRWVYQFEAGKPTATLGPLLRVLDELGLQLEVRQPSTEGGPADAVDLDVVLRAVRGTEDE